MVADAAEQLNRRARTTPRAAVAVIDNMLAELLACGWLQLGSELQQGSSGADSREAHSSQMDGADASGSAAGSSRHKQAEADTTQATSSSSSSEADVQDAAAAVGHLCLGTSQQGGIAAPNTSSAAGHKGVSSVACVVCGATSAKLRRCKGPCCRSVVHDTAVWSARRGTGLTTSLLASRLNRSVVGRTRIDGDAK